MQGCLKNNRIAQEKLYKYFFGLMYHICREFVSEKEEIISLVNEGFLKVFISIESFDEQKGNFEIWAKRVVKNNCIDHFRAKKRKPQTVPLEGNDPVAEDNPALYSIVENEVMLHLKKMPEATQRVFNLHVFKGFSHKEIADNMHIAESTSRWHVLEARRVLKKVSHKIL